MSKNNINMKKVIIILAVILIGGWNSLSAQKYAFVDMELILNKIPAYELANEQLNQLSKKWQTEIDTKKEEAKTLYKSYQSEVVFLSEDMKVKKEEAILQKEKEVVELQKKYFGPEGELFKKRESLIKPIQDDIYNAIKNIAEDKQYMMVLDRASSQNVIFASPRIDISNEVLAKLGISK